VCIAPPYGRRFITLRICWKWKASSVTSPIKTLGQRLERFHHWNAGHGYGFTRLTRKKQWKSFTGSKKMNKAIAGCAHSAGSRSKVNFRSAGTVVGEDSQCHECRPTIRSTGPALGLAGELSRWAPREPRKRRRDLLLTAMITLLALLASGMVEEAAGSADRTVRLTEGRFDKTLQLHVNLRYLLYLPQEYGEQKARWPMILYLHGGAGRGSDFGKMSWYPLPRLLREPNRNLPFVVLMPQCSEDDIWDAEGLLALVNAIAGSYAIDQERIYLVGYSMGGTGAWRLALAHPERFAAIAPMSGYADPGRAVRLKGVPTWVFHGAKDTVIQPGESEKMVKALKAAGVDVRFSLDPERGHAPPSDGEHEQLFEWFLTHRRGKRTGEADADRP